MSKNYFEIIRAGVNTTFQDKGRDNLYHIGIPFSGAMDNRNYLLANKLVGNKLNLPVIEFAYQGPLLRFYGDKINIVIIGQDPYHGKDQADGLAFSYKGPGKTPPSLRNILLELGTRDIRITNTDLTGWTESGVFLLNSIYFLFVILM